MKYASNRRPFDTSQVCRGGGRRWRRIEREVFRGDQAALAQNRRALEGVVQFTHVSRPFVLQQRVTSVEAQFEVRPTRRLADVVEKRVAERQDIAAPVAQGRQLDLEHLQPIVEILAKVAVQDGLTKVAIRRRQHSYVGAQPTRPAQPLKFTFLQNS